MMTERPGDWSVERTEALRAFWNGDQPRRVIVELPPIGPDNRCTRCGATPSRDTGSCRCHGAVIDRLATLDTPPDNPRPLPGLLGVEVVLDEAAEALRTAAQDGYTVSALATPPAEGLDVDGLARALYRAIPGYQRWLTYPRHTASTEEMQAWTRIAAAIARAYAEDSHD
jgi:hypothetical protein